MSSGLDAASVAQTSAVDVVVIVVVVVVDIDGDVEMDATVDEPAAPAADALDMLSFRRLDVYQRANSSPWSTTS
jgi:hypothetical protein